MADVFISHASEDAPTARDICAALEAAGVTCWMAPRDIRPGQDYRSEILRGVSESASLILLYSPAASRSEHVAREVSLADDENKPIYPLRMDTRELEGPLRYVLQGKQWVDFQAAPGPAISSIATAIKGKAPAQAPKLHRRVFGLSRGALTGIGIALAFLVAIGIGGWFGYKAWSNTQVIAACDAAAMSELELGAKGEGVALGSIDPKTALTACRAALKIEPKSPRLLFNYFRALFISVPAEINNNGANMQRVLMAMRGASDAGHPEAMILMAASAKGDDNDETVPPSAEAMAGLIARLTPALEKGDARAAYLLSQIEYPMCQVDGDKPYPEPLAGEQGLFRWFVSQYSIAHPDQALALVAATGPQSFKSATSDNDACGLISRYLLARSSAGNLAGGEFALANALSFADAPDPEIAHIEGRAPAALLADAASRYAPAAYYAARREVACKDQDGAPQRAQDSSWRRLLQVADGGYRPAMGDVAGLILAGCAPSSNSYDDARRWLTHATAGMEVQP